jgi:DNA polymerase
MAQRRNAREDATPFVPESHDLAVLRKSVQGCRGCSLYLHANQAVFGEGPSSALVMLVGEQPGDKEDKAGHPFVGPAGRILNDALAAAGIERAVTYVTNAVKHFKFEERGKIRLHKRPKPGEVRACRPWFLAELAAVRPRVVVLLGATAAQALLGSAFRVTRDRGKPLASEFAPVMIATVHPSSILRAPDETARADAFAAFVEDLKVAARSAKMR